MLIRRVDVGTLLLALLALPATALPAWGVEPKYLPSDTEIVISVNIKQMLASEVAKTYRDLIDQAKGFLETHIQNNPAAKYLERAGFDVFRDLHAVTVASNGGKDLDAGIIVIEGNFNAGKVRAAAAEIARDNAEVLKIIKIGGKEAWEITPPGDKRVYAALLDDKTLVACGAEEVLKETLQRSNGAGRVALKQGVSSLLKTTSDKQSFSFVATGPALQKVVEESGVRNAEAAAGMLGALEGLSAAVTLTRDVQFQLGMTTKDEETAKKAAAAANGGLFMVRTLAEQKAKENVDLQPLVDISKSLRITSQGNNILLRGEVTTENLQRLIKNLPSRLSP
jgi:hypothetical protein